MRTTNGLQVRYPGLVVCDGRVGDLVRTLRDALVIFEVLSDDTEETDIGRKREDYGRLAGLRNYVLVEQERPAVTVLARAADRRWEDRPAAEGFVSLPEIGFNIPLATAYATVRFG